ncbi:MAG: glycosyltransferase family 2 protein [Bacteroidetes bacterium]|nr:glycosyltransferase family 2 protein [Bacteroidota bacterium]
MANTGENPLVSVLTTVYNREKYIAAAIESILASTYENFELILVDDQSKDGSVEIIRKYEKMDARVHLFINEKNLGDYPNRMKAAGLAKGKYIKYVDADDMIYPTGLQVMVSMMEQFPEAGYGLFSLPQDKERLYPYLLTPEQAYQRHYFKERLFHKAPLSAIILKKAFDDIGGFTGKRFIGDFEFWHIISRKYPVVLGPQGVVWYREHEEQEMQVNRTDFTVPFKYLRCSEEMLQDPDCPLNNEDREKALRKVKWNEARYILGVGKNHSIRTARALKKESGMSFCEIVRRVSGKH